jgi:hypothetical protein
MSEKLYAWSPRFLYPVAGVLLIMGLISILDRPHSRRSVNEWGAARNIRAVITLQRKYALAHPDKGFACELLLLKSSGRWESGDYEPLLLVTGTQAGYKFFLSGCSADAKGSVVHYQVTAVPIEHGKTGVAAFCADESGVLRFELDGFAIDCFASHRVLK